jgi:hypothetical protein
MGDLEVTALVPDVPAELGAGCREVSDVGIRFTDRDIATVRGEST